jgi:hypothetical protein
LNGFDLVPKKDWLEKFLRDFDQYLGTWVGLFFASTILMGWVEKMFVWRMWDDPLKRYINVPMFPTPDWWTNPLGIVAAFITLCLGKLGIGYLTNSKYNSEQGKQPEPRPDKPKETT